MANTGWDEFEIGAVLRSFDENGNYSRDHSKTYKVADWRVNKPIFNRETCIDCDMCWLACPDTCFIVEEVENKRGKKQFFYIVLFCFRICIRR